MKKLSINSKFFVFLFLFSGANILNVSATHNRAGEITLKQIKDLTYEITITTYTYTLSGADRPQLEVQWGDNTFSIAPRDSLFNLPNNYRRNVYNTQHTFPGPGIYTIVVQDPNRNYGVKNIPNSVNVIFSIKTTISINPQIGLNSTPILLNPPYDKAGLYQIFIHNPGAFDPDGDSISYSLSVCTEQNGEPIPGYTLPQSSDTLFVNPITGDLVWNTPIDTGIYNIAMNISEWRRGIKIGNIVRDMQVEVYRTTNHAPINDSLINICVIAGNTVNLVFRSKDQDGDMMTHFITGGPFSLKSRAYTSQITSVPGEIVTRFTWKTSCDEVRKQPYAILLKTMDNNSKLSLVDIDNQYINVLGPPPNNINLVPGSTQVRVQWKAGECSNIKKYNIYRKVGSSGYAPDSCTYGLPGYADFMLTGHTNSGTDSIYTDNNNGKGLLQGTEYCYRVVAVYPDDAESIPSDEVCTILVPGSPSILNTSVTKTDAETGEIFISWAKPLHLDTIPAPGPYEYIIYRSDNLFGLNLTEIHRFNTNDLNDTVFIDKNMNTNRFPFAYSVELYNNAADNRFLIGKPEIASTMYPDLSEADNSIDLKIVKNVPWVNYENTIYRYNKLLEKFDSIFVTDKEFYSDHNLVNNKEYCYQVNAKGLRRINGIDYFIQNFSHVGCATPIDTVAPCPPVLTVSSVCDSFYNHLTWINLTDSCSLDIIKYNIYYTPVNGTIKLTDSTTNMFYNHYPQACLDGCYFVTAVDSFGNESIKRTITCAKECYYYELPNVFSPDGDGINDILHPSLYLPCIDKIDLKIFNRWGQMVFHTNVPEINWDGKVNNSSHIASTGVYYYSCDIYKSSEKDPVNKVGFIHVFSDKNTKNSGK
jgi:gliding motility-associated-like protein